MSKKPGKKSEKKRAPPLGVRVHEFLVDREAPFTIEDASAALKSDSGRAPSRKKLTEELSMHEHVFEHWEHEGFYVPRATFFRSARFLIQLTDWECSQGVLVPGHRFIPFCSSEVFPAASTLTWRSGVRLPTRTVSCPLTDAMIYFTLLGSEDTLKYLLIDHEENNWVLESSAEDPREVRLSVFDISTLLVETGLRPGDRLLLTVEDWRKGRFQAEPAALSKAESPGAVRRWCEDLEEALLEVADTIGPTDPNDHFAHAFFFGESYLTRWPAIHLGGFLAASRRIGLQRCGGQIVLWDTEDDLEEFHPDSFTAPPRLTGTTESLDEMLGDIGLSINSFDIRAYMRDALYRDVTELKHVKERLFAGRTLEFASKQQEHAFRETLQMEWNEIQSSYNRFADHGVSEVRSKLLDINDAILAHLRRLDRADVSPEDLPPKDTVGLGELAGLVSQTLELLDDPEVDMEEVKSLSRSLDDLEQIARSMMEDICAVLREKGFDL